MNDTPIIVSVFGSSSFPTSCALIILRSSTPMKQESSWDLSQNVWISDVYVDTASYEQPIMASTSFFPGSRGRLSNVVFCSLDCVHFFVNSDLMSGISFNAFQGELPGAHTQGALKCGLDIVFIPELSSVLDVLLHFLHGLAFSENIPTLQAFVDGVSAMPKYDIDPTQLLVPSNPCYKHILVLAPAHPLEVYAMAASLNLYPLAAASSSHLLSYPLGEISQEMALLMGGAYLNRLFALHSHRREMFKSIIRDPPYPHPPTDDCDFLEQKSLRRAWTMTAGYFVWEAKGDLSPAVLKSTFENLKMYVKCKDCRETLENRVRNVISRWVIVTRTIE